MVLVIVGLLVGGIFVGNDLIKQFQLRSVIREMDQFQTAILAFRLKYNGIPGDIRNATDFFGTNPNCAAGLVGTGTETCNGNGNSEINMIGPSQDPPREQFYAWQHLANAKMINGFYTGLSDTYYECVPKVNCPTGRLNDRQAYFMATFLSRPVNHWWPYQDALGTTVGIARTTGAAYPADPILTPQEAFGLDLKVDNGKPGTGYWRTFGPTGNSFGCAVNGDTLADITDAEAEQEIAIYNPTKTTVLCSFLIYYRI